MIPRLYGAIGHVRRFGTGFGAVSTKRAGTLR